MVLEVHWLGNLLSYWPFRDHMFPLLVEVGGSYVLTHTHKVWYAKEVECTHDSHRLGVMRLEVK